MTTLECTTAAPSIAPTRPAARRASLVSVYLQLSKARLTAMVLVTTAVGYILAPWDNGDTGGWNGLWGTVLGTAFLAAGASTFNQLLEIRRDGLMDRTKNRPLPSGRITPLHGLVFGLVCTILGAVVLDQFSTTLALGLGLLNVILYALVYTPLKPRTSLNTLVGAIVGALPPMMGWAAASGTLSIGAFLLGGLLLIWQIPHFLALAWMYRTDYAKGGFRMLPVIDPAGRLTCMLIVVYSIALLPLGPAAMMLGVTGWISAIFSLVPGAMMLAAALNLSRNKTRENARRVFFVSILYLPLVLMMMVLDSRQTAYHGVQQLNSHETTVIVEPGQ